MRCFNDEYDEKRSPFIPSSLGHLGFIRHSCFPQNMHILNVGSLGWRNYCPFPIAPIFPISRSNYFPDRQSRRPF
jgi:hypothetical protein